VKDGVVVQFDKEATQTRDYCIAALLIRSSATHLAARPDSLGSLGTGSSLRKETLVQDDNQTALLPRTAALRMTPVKIRHRLFALGVGGVWGKDDSPESFGAFALLGELDGVGGNALEGRQLRHYAGRERGSLLIFYGDEGAH
jgi:hypothetical protein